MSQAGVTRSGPQLTFTVWAPEKSRMELYLSSPGEKKFEMKRGREGYFEITIPDPGPDCRYSYAPDGAKPYPDPASHFQPDGVHSPSAVVNHDDFIWSDDKWKGIPFAELVFYELHVGTFTPEGTFEAIIPRLKSLAETGINALELMPVSEFPGRRNWGYDGVYPYSVHSSYGGPAGLKRLVDAAHNAGIAVFLDIVFNHLGPEGNYFAEFGPYFTKSYSTPWGSAINMDGAWSDGVRAYFSDNILHWYKNYHLDGARLDAIHTIYDKGAVHFWELVDSKLHTARQRGGHPFYLVAESDLNSPRVVKSPELGGYGFNAQWLDDFHHSLYVLLDKNGQERYTDFGRTEQLVKAICDGFVHSGEYVEFRKRRHGASSAGLSGDKFIVFNQNHDQIGNRVGGERLSMLVDFDRQKVASAMLLLAPYIPMFFMGEEYGEDAPFFYFVSHTEEDLIEKVVEGRKKEFEDFASEQEPLNPQQKETFEKSRIQWEKRQSGKYRIMLEWNKLLIGLRRSNPALQNFNKNDVSVNILAEKAFVLYRSSADQQTELACIVNLSTEAVTWNAPSEKPQWKLLLDSSDQRWQETSDWNEQTAEKLLNVADKITVRGCSVKVLELQTELN